MFGTAFFVIFRLMNILPYTLAHREACLAIFDSNRPKFFAESERPQFIGWLDNHTTTNYFVMEENDEIIACGGVWQEKEAAGLSWGMVHSAFHGKGFGKAFTQYRVNKMLALFPGKTYTIETSQHTVPFYEKMGFRTEKVTKDGFAPGIDKYDMKMDASPNE